MRFFKPFDTPELPCFPDREVNILDFGAVGDGATDCTSAIRAAIENIAALGGGRVVIPSGKFNTGPIHFKSNVNLHLERGATLEFSERFEDYLPVVESVLAGVKCYSCSHLIYGNRCENIALTGEGVLNGHGRVWDWMKKHQPGMEDLMRKGQECAPLSERVYDKESDGVRPRFLQLQHCERVLIEGVKFINSPTWTIHPVFSKNVTVRNVTIKNPVNSPNSDGINFESCKRCLLTDCYVDTGDDAVCVKAGRGRDAWSWNAPCEDIEIRNITGLSGMGSVTLGSETSASIRNIYFHDCNFESRAIGINVKTMKGRGGEIKNIDFENISVGEARRVAIKISFRYDGEPLDDQSAPITDVPDLENISVENFRCERANAALQIEGLSGYPLKNIYLDGINIAAADFGKLYDVEGLGMNGVSITPLPNDGRPAPTEVGYKEMMAKLAEQITE